MIEQLFGSKTRVKLLKLFLSNPNRSFYVREITRKVDEQINSVRRELANLLDIGIIGSDSTANRLYYEVDQKSPHYMPMRGLFGLEEVVGTDEVVKKTKVKPKKEVEKKTTTKTKKPKPAVEPDMAKDIKKLGDVHAALLTGAFTRDEESPVDLLIVGDVGIKELDEFVKGIEEELSIDVRFTVMGKTDYEYRMSIRDRFLSSILRGKYTVVLDKSDLFSA